MKADELLQDSAVTFKLRNAEHGDNYKFVGNVMQALFPEGYNFKTAEEMNRFHLLMLLVVKLTRYCNNFSFGGHDDSLNDISVYAAMLRSIDQEKQEKEEIPF